MNELEESMTFTDSKFMPIDYIILKLRISLNKELYEKKVIEYEVFKKMQELLIKKMNHLIDKNNNS